MTDLHCAPVGAGAGENINEESPKLDRAVARRVAELGVAARAAARKMARATSAQKDLALRAMAEHLEAATAVILESNAEDLRRARSEHLEAPLLDRLELTPARVRSMAESLRQVAQLKDPVGEISGPEVQPNGLKVGRMRVPLGVIGIIYESRPNVTADAAGLCLKAGNACILRGGSEALHTNLAIAESLCGGIADAGLPAAAVQLIATTERAAVGAMLRMEDYIDVLVPRGGRRLVERVAREARVPVIRHFDGICHVYVDAAADLEMAVEVAYNAKTYRYGICGAMETLLVHAAVAERLLPPLAARFAAKGVELRGCPATRRLLLGIALADETDWRTEYLGPSLSVRVVESLDAAMEHIADYGSGHTDSIVTEDRVAADRFLAEVDSSSVMLNAPTCWADGFEYGLGAEIGISTGKLHARGPVGLEGLTCRKFVIFGRGQVRVPA